MTFSAIIRFVEDRQALTVTSHHHTFMIEAFLMPRVQNLLERENKWFQQDGATAHMVQISISAFCDLFPLWMISYFCDVPWSPLSADFFNWGYLKGKVW
jgi:hypothetical protein